MLLCNILDAADSAIKDGATQASLQVGCLHGEIVFIQFFPTDLTVIVGKSIFLLILVEPTG